MKGIVLAGGAGTRLHPITYGVSKQLLGVYDKPMIYYPISILMLAGIRDILIITTPEDQPAFIRLLGDGSQFGVQFSYEVQERPDGLPQAFVIGEKFIGDDSVALVLGDNILYGAGLGGLLKEAAKLDKGGLVFGSYVSDPERFGCVEFDAQGNVLSIEEKPAVPKSKYAVIGLYFFDNDVIEIAKGLKPSPRGETEIVAVLETYRQRGDLHVRKMGRGYAWLDTGTHDSMLEAANFIKTIETRQSLQVACLEEIAYRAGWISKEQVLETAQELRKTEYGHYLSQMVEEG